MSVFSAFFAFGSAAVTSFLANGSQQNFVFSLRESVQIAGNLKPHENGF